jgi:hypothetical protein
MSQGPPASALLFGFLVMLSVLPGAALGSGPARAAYPLDELPRTLEEGAALPCESSAVPLTQYRGEQLRYQKPLQIHPVFRAQLVAFEQIVRDVATQHYGRPPKQIVHLGGYSCRRMRRYPTWVSEHALGNAIDVAGFDFAPVKKGALRVDVPATLRRGFSVRLERHWNARGADAPHSRFLRALAQGLIDRPDVFNVVLGPAWPGHKNHFHLDHAPYRVVEVF